MRLPRVNGQSVHRIESASRFAGGIPITLRCVSVKSVALGTRVICCEMGEEALLDSCFPTRVDILIPSFGQIGLNYNERNRVHYSDTGAAFIRNVAYCRNPKPLRTLCLIFVDRWGCWTATGFSATSSEVTRPSYFCRRRFLPFSLRRQSLVRNLHPL